MSNERTFATSSVFEAGVFDGLCMDAEGAVWAARWGSSRVVRYLPDGTLDIEIVMPKALNVTCCVFGGMFATLCWAEGSVLMTSTGRRGYAGSLHHYRVLWRDGRKLDPKVSARWGLVPRED